MARVITGFEQLRASLEALRTDVAVKTLKSATRTAANIIRKRAAERAPVRTTGGVMKTYKGAARTPGYLKRHIAVALYYNKRAGAVIADIGPTAEAFYGSQFIELGTSRIAKRPWLVPAYAGVIGTVEDTFASALRNAIDRAAAKGGSL